MNKKFLIILVLLIFSIIFGLKSYNEVKTYQYRIDFYHSNISEALSSYEIEGNYNIDEVIKLISNFKLITQLSKTSDYSANNNLLIDALTYFEIYFNNELVKVSNKEKISIGELNKQLDFLQEILLFFNNHKNDTFEKGIYEDFLLNLGIENEEIEHFIH